MYLKESGLGIYCVVKGLKQQSYKRSTQFNAKMS